MSLKDVITSDSSVIFNIDEFGERHNINGIEIDCIQDSVLSEQAAGAGTFAAYGIRAGGVVLFARTAELHGKISRGAVLLFDRKNYLIESVSENMGISEITLSQNQN